MAFPAVQEAIETSTNTAGTSHVVTLPTPVAGQLLLIILDKGSTAATINAHTELTELLDENLANGLYIAYRWMDGNEPASYTLTSSASTRTARIAYRISGAENPATQAPQIGTTSSGSSATPDPPASAAPGSTKDFLFIAFYGAAGEEADDDTWSNTSPTGYTPSPPRMKACGIAGTNLGGMIAAAERQLNTGAAQDPGTFAKDVSAAWRSQTIMVHPASSQTFQQALVAIAIAAAVLSTQATFLRALSATAVASPVLATKKILKQLLTAVAVGVAALSTKLVFKQTLTAVATGVATLTDRVTFRLVLAATAIAATAMTVRQFLKRTIAAVAIGNAVMTPVQSGGAVVRSSGMGLHIRIGI